MPSCNIFCSLWISLGGLMGLDCTSPLFNNKGLDEDTSNMLRSGIEGGMLRYELSDTCTVLRECCEKIFVVS